jgi:hypothetical protein
MLLLLAIWVSFLSMFSTYASPDRIETRAAQWQELCESLLKGTPVGASEFAQVYLRVVGTANLTFEDVDGILESSEPTRIFALNGGSAVRQQLKSALRRLKAYYLESLSVSLQVQAHAEIIKNLEELRLAMKRSRAARADGARKTQVIKRGIIQIDAKFAQISPDGKFLTARVGAKRYEVREVDSERVVIARSFAEEDHECRWAFSPDGKLFAIAQDQEGVLELYKLPEGTRIRQFVLPKPNQVFGEPAFSGDSSRIAIVNRLSQQILIWDLTRTDMNPAQDQSVGATYGTQLLGIPGTTDSFLIPGGPHVQSVRVEGRVVTALQSPEIGMEVRFHGFWPGLDQGLILVNGSNNFRAVKLQWSPWQVSDPKLIPEAFAENLTVSIASQAPRVSILAPAWNPMRLKLWDTSTGDLIWSKDLPLLFSSGPNQAISPDGRYIAVADRFEALWVYDTSSEISYRYDFKEKYWGDRRGLQFSDDGKHILVQKSDLSWLLFRLEVVLFEH